ncbi:MAG: hypothetical protein ACRDM0_08100 [Thermoleophilaceae bacterium]
MGTRTSGSEGGGEQTTTRKRRTAARLRPYFSIVQRKVVQPNDFADLDVLEQRLLAFGRRYERIAEPFEWKFTRRDLDRLLAKLDAVQPSERLAA